MRDTANAAKVGLLVAIVLGAAYAIYRLVDERTRGSDGYEVYALFEDASGLVPKSRVVVAGIPVGTIERIRLEGNRARVDIRVARDVILYEDATVLKKSASLLGESLLSIEPGSVTRPRLPEGSQIATGRGPPEMSDIFETVGRITDSVQRIVQQVERTFGTDEGGQQMQAALRNLSQALEAINRTIQSNEQAIGATLQNVQQITAQAAPEIRRILDNLEQVTADIRVITGQARPGLEGAAPQVGDTLETINRAAHRLEETLDDVRTITGRTAEGEGTLGRLTSDETLIDEVEGVAQGIGDIVGPIARLQTIVQLRADYNFLANTFKSYFQLRLMPREDRYYFIDFINDPRGNTQYEETTVTTTPAPRDRPASYTERRVRTTDSFRFSIGLAKRIYFATFRFGIIESTGGVGMDLHFLDDNLEVNTDIFAIGERQYPRVRVNFAWQIISRLWILGGVDDIVNDSRDFYLGAMLRFNDDDLKSILPFAGSAAIGGR